MITKTKTNGRAGAGDLGVALKSPGAVTSFPPCIMSHHSRAKDGRKVPHLVSLLAFIAMGPGPLGPAIAGGCNHIKATHALALQQGESTYRFKNSLVSTKGILPLGLKTCPTPECTLCRRLV
jgi:hypothetical protein